MAARDSEALIASAREFTAAVLRPRAGEFDAAGAVPAEVLREMAERGFLGAILPAEYGGGGIDALAYGRLTHELGKGCSSARALLTVHTSLVGETLARLGTLEQKQQWLPRLADGTSLASFALTEPEVGSDAAACKSRYIATAGGFLLSGKKKWITYGAIADLFLVFANCEGSGSAFLVERGAPGLRTRPMTGLMAGRGAHIAEVEFDNVFIPQANLVGREGAGFSFVANTALFFGRYSIAWAGTALAEAALEEMVAYAGQREQFGVKLRRHQLIQALIADALCGVHVSRAICEKIGRMRCDNDDEAVNEVNVAKYMSAKVAMEVAHSAVQVFGGNGISNAYPVERLFREAKVLEIIEGSSQIQQMILANYAFSHYRRRPARRATATAIPH